MLREMTAEERFPHSDVTTPTRPAPSRRLRAAVTLTRRCSEATDGVSLTAAQPSRSSSSEGAGSSQLRLRPSVLLPFS